MLVYFPCLLYVKNHLSRQLKIPKDALLAIPINKTLVEKKYLDPYNSDGLNMFLVACLGMVLMLLGSIYGFVLYWGPIIWGLIGLISGSLIGIAIDYKVKKVTRKKTIKKHIVDVILLVRYEKEKVDMIEEILSKHYTLGTARIY